MSMPAQRLDAIDRLRALTMVLMIFVNDLWSLSGVPVWLEHVGPGVDGMGLSDVVFPAFLFIVGLSLPFALDARRNRGESLWAQSLHVVLRSIALIVMGVWLVNGETINGDATGISRGAWSALSILCFILIWNAWPKAMPTVAKRALQVIGAVILLVMAIIYRGGEGDVAFGPSWWGILGLIGWAYLVAGLIGVWTGGRLIAFAVAWAAFVVLSLAWAAGLVAAPLRSVPEPIIGGTMTALVLGGAVAAKLFQSLCEDRKRLFLIYGAITVALIALYFVTRPIWGLSKLSGTPAWLFICSAFTLIGFALLIGLNGRGEGVFRLIKPAGTDTLLTYLIPYLAYAVFTATGMGLPETFLAGGVGLIKALLFALICVWVAGTMARWLGIRLKL